MTTSFSNATIRRLAWQVVHSVSAANEKGAIKTLTPLLDTKCPFSKLDLLGREIGRAGLSDPPRFFEAFDAIIEYNAMGSFVIVGQALIPFLEGSFDQVMTKSREYIVRGDAWYVCDIIGERSLGQALVDYFGRTLPWLDRLLGDDDKWVKRSVGVAIHFFSKRVLDDPAKTRRLLRLVEPYIEEKQVDVVKGIGWGLKTIGKHHPDLVVEFLEKQIKTRKRMPRLMMRKASTYLDKNRSARIAKLMDRSN
jgi:3-methyladenine DNA glycosylase AlkD